MKLMYLKRLGKILLLTISLILILSFFTTILYYFNLLSSQIYNILKLFISLFSLFIGSYQIGKKAEKKGILEGIKLGGILIFLFLILHSILFQENLNFKLFFYDLILLLTSAIGGMLGINQKKEKT